MRARLIDCSTSTPSSKFLRTTPEQLRIISCHLGNGASVAAIEYGRSVETSMGFTPLEGLVMGTRGGDVDPGILLHLLKSGEFDASTLDRLLNKHSELEISAHDAGAIANHLVPLG